MTTYLFSAVRGHEIETVGATPEAEYGLEQRIDVELDLPYEVIGRGEFASDDAAHQAAVEFVQRG